MKKTEMNLMLAVVKSNAKNGYFTKEQTEWLINQVEELQDELNRQRKHEDFLLGELDRLGWFDDLF